MKSVTIRFGLQSLSRSFSDEATVSQVITDPTVRGYLGYGDNVRVLANGAAIDPAYTRVHDGMAISLETKANSKAAPDQILVRFGINAAQKYSEYPMTVRQIKTDATLRAALGYGDNVRITMNGIALSDDAVIPAGSTVTVETLANQKAN